MNVLTLRVIPTRSIKPNRSYPHSHSPLLLFAHFECGPSWTAVCRPRAKATIITLQHWSCKISQVDQKMDNFLILFLALFPMLL